MLVIACPPSANACVRMSPRKALNLSGKLLDQDALPTRILLVDISKGGMGIVAGNPVMRGAPCAVAFDVELEGMQRRVNVWGKVVHSTMLKNGMCRIGVQNRDCDAQSRLIIEKIFSESLICGH